MTTLSNEQLREILLENAKHIALKQMYADTKPRNFYGIDEAAASIDVEKEIEYILHLVDNMLASQRQSILKEVREKVIGENETDYRNLNGNFNIVKKKNYRNQLRAEQRIKLDAMEKQS